jgi:hypothetical protein
MEYIHDYSGDKIKKIEIGVACLDSRDAHRILMGILEGTRHLGRPRRRWEDNINMDFQEMGWRGMDWIAPTQDRDSWRPLMNALT